MRIIHSITELSAQPYKRHYIIPGIPPMPPPMPPPGGPASEGKSQIMASDVVRRPATLAASTIPVRVT